MKDRKCIIVDMDGTLANCDHRTHLVKAKKWDEFYAACEDDQINQWCRMVMDSLGFYYDVEVVIVTGRPEKYREKTVKWLASFSIYPDALLMRKDGDFRKDAVIKEEILKLVILPEWDVLFALEDRKQVVDMWRKNGITCLQCAEGEF